MRALRRMWDGVVSAGFALGALAGCLAAGYVFAALVAPARSTPMLPWLAGRALGLAGYVALTVLTALGVWIRHPWRFRWPVMHPEVRLRAHATLGAATVVLIGGHLVALASDHYAGVGWRGAFLPGVSRYRTVPVGLGVFAFDAMVIVSVTAALAGRIGGDHWLAVHRFAIAVFALAWFHGALAGTDTAGLRSMYAVTGLVVAGLVVTRYAITGPSGEAISHPAQEARR